MKKLIFGFIALFLLAATPAVHAQEWKELSKEANKSFNRYRASQDDSEKKALMTEAVEAIDKAMDLTDIPDDEKADIFLLGGDIYNEIATEINTAKTLNLNTAGASLPEVTYPAIRAQRAYANGLKHADKGRHERAATQGLRAVQNFLSFRGIEYFQSSDFPGAKLAFEAMLEAHNLLTEAGEESALASEDDLKNQYYLAGIAAFNANDMAAAETYLVKLYNEGTQEPAVYEYLYKMESNKSDAETAYKYLQEGRKQFPEEIGLLFAEINHFLKLGKSDELIDKIKQAIKTEPDNISLYNVLGNTYDNLYQNAVKEGNTEEAQEYFKQAFEQFKIAYEKEPSNGTAVYSMGQLFYNKAALKTQELQEYASDYSSEGMKKYEAAREAVFKQFDNALPFFQLSEALNPNDANTLIALKEIFAKKDDVETSNIFKERLDKVQDGGENASSHYSKSDVDIDAAISKVEMDM